MFPSLPQSWFEPPERLQRLQEAAHSWIGTPFFLHGTHKGPQGGVSCQTLVAAIYQEAGFIRPDWQVPTAPMDLCFGLMKETVEGRLAAHFAPVELATPGDLICFRLHRQGHLGIAIDACRFVHCLRQGGVCLSRLDDATYMKVAARIWRPVTPV